MAEDRHRESGLRARLERGEFIVAPGIFDGFSGLLAQRSGYAAVYLSGYAVSASRYGLPDAGLVGLREMLEAITVLRRVCEKPMIADADTGYGGLLNVQHTVREYEALGVAAIQIEDQEMPKKCGHTQGKRVVKATEMAAKIEVAVESRASAETLIVARTDSRASLGLDEAIRRGRLYRRAGADIVFVEAPESVEELARIGAELEPPLLVNVVPRGFKTPRLSAEELQRLGFAVAIHPGLLALAGAGAMHSALERLGREDVDEPANGLPFSPHELVGFPTVWADEARWQERYAELEDAVSVSTATDG